MNETFLVLNYIVLYTNSTKCFNWFCQQEAMCNNTLNGVHKLSDSMNLNFSGQTYFNQFSTDETSSFKFWIYVFFEVFILTLVGG